MPVEEPTDSPPPPTPQAQPAPGNDALTAREGAGPSNYGLTIGDGSGSRIGGQVGSGLGGFNRAAYASYLEGEKIGRASCRARGSQYVLIPGVAGAFTKKPKKLQLHK